jgi:hypothetical protein
MRGVGSRLHFHRRAMPLSLMKIPAPALAEIPVCAAHCLSAGEIVISLISVFSL